jgi:hypothetical protein
MSAESDVGDAVSAPRSRDGEQLALRLINDHLRLEMQPTTPALVACGILIAAALA